LEAFFDPSDSYFLFAEERGYHKWALAHSSSCLVSCPKGQVKQKYFYFYFGNSDSANLRSFE
jgi:hypothetical protein